MDMRTVLLIIGLSFLAVCPYLNAQKKDNISRYETFVYTNERLDVYIRNEYLNQQEDRQVYHGPLGLAYLNIEKELAGDCVSPIIEVGPKQATAMMPRKANEQSKWEAIVKAENVYQETQQTPGAFNNFYSRQSYIGPMDPSGLLFNGIGCLRTINGDTAFYFSCHLDVTKFNRIVYDSKFQLSLDTLIINPFKGHLPYSDFDARFSFERYKNLQYVIEIRLFASWFTDSIRYHKDRELGSFVISVPIVPTDLDDQGGLYYVRTPEAPVKYTVAGESYIVPRSCQGFNDADDRINWGTGDFKIEITLKETCDITDEYRKNWKDDWKQRKKKDLVQSNRKTISSKRWDEINKQWVITTLNVPPEMSNEDIIKAL